MPEKRPSNNKKLKKISNSGGASRSTAYEDADQHLHDYERDEERRSLPPCDLEGSDEDNSDDDQGAQAGRPRNSGRPRSGGGSGGDAGGDGSRGSGKGTLGRKVVQAIRDFNASQEPENDKLVRQLQRELDELKDSMGIVLPANFAETEEFLDCVTHVCSHMLRTSDGLGVRMARPGSIDKRQAGIDWAVHDFFVDLKIDHVLTTNDGMRLFRRVRELVVKRVNDNKSNLKKFLLARLKDDFMPWIKLADGSTSNLEDLDPELKDDLVQITLALFLHLELHVVKSRPQLMEDFNILLEECWDVEKLEDFTPSLRLGPRRVWVESEHRFETIHPRRRNHRRNRGPFRVAELPPNPFPRVGRAAAEEDAAE
eukprot:jgi/Mesvir1/13252/Mv12231-RA.1